MNRDNVKIFVIAHKPIEMPDMDGYFGMQVGLADDLGFKYRDNIGDNISNKNSSYCELTALYWIWKNIKEDDIVGIVHYRRFLRGKNGILSEDEIKNILSDYDLILPKPEKILKWSVGEQWDKIHHKEDLDVARNVIAKKYPEYIEAFDTVLNKHEFYAYNIMISKKELFDKYAEWLFDILSEIEKNVDMENYDDYNKRLYGFLGERLLNVWVEKNNLKVKTLPMIYTEENYKNKSKRILKRALGLIRK